MSMGVQNAMTQVIESGYLKTHVDLRWGDMRWAGGFT